MCNSACGKSRYNTADSFGARLAPRRIVENAEWIMENCCARLVPCGIKIVIKLGTPHFTEHKVV